MIKVNVTHPQLHAYAKQLPVGEKTAVNIARAMIDDAQEPRIYEYKIKGRTNGGLAFSTVEAALNPLAYIRPRKQQRKRAEKPNPGKSQKNRQAAPTKEPEATKRAEKPKSSSASCSIGATKPKKGLLKSRLK